MSLKIWNHLANGDPKKRNHFSQNNLIIQLLTNRNKNTLRTVLLDRAEDLLKKPAHINVCNLFALLTYIFSFTLLHVHQEVIKTGNIKQQKSKAICKNSKTAKIERANKMDESLFVVTVFPVVLHSNPGEEAFLSELVPLIFRGKSNM